MSAPPPAPPEGGGANVRVVCRFRPLNAKERAVGSGGAELAWSLPEDGCRVTSREQDLDDYAFTFDSVLPLSATQEDVYAVVEPVVADVLTGYNGTILAFGQTSSGKTHTMEGAGMASVAMDAPGRGVIPRMVGTMFAGITAAATTTEFALRVSFVEIYQERIRDLLSDRLVGHGGGGGGHGGGGGGAMAAGPRTGSSPEEDGDFPEEGSATVVDPGNLRVFEDKEKGIFVAGATEVAIASPDAVFAVLRAGQAARAVSATGMNANSSRSHSVFILSLEQRDLVALSTRVGKLYVPARSRLVLSRLLLTDPRLLVSTHSSPRCKPGTWWTWPARRRWRRPRRAARASTRRSTSTRASARWVT